MCSVAGNFGDLLRSVHAELIGLCAFIFRTESAFTSRRLGATHGLQDKKLPLLQQHPLINAPIEPIFGGYGGYLYG